MLNTAMTLTAPDGLSQSTDPAVFTELYNGSTNLCVWQRELPPEITHYSDYLLNHHHFAIEIRLSGTLTELERELTKALPANCARQAFIDNIIILGDMLTCLLGAKAVGMRLCVAGSATCPRFHVDKLGCRLITTYRGPATQWLDNNDIDRNKLGPGAEGKPDSESGLYSRPDSIYQLSAGDVALLKGELWPGNEGKGIVHRSPPLEESQRRLFVTMDAVT